MDEAVWQVALAAQRAAGQRPAAIPIGVWVTVAVGMSTMASLALMTLVRREFRTEFPHIDQFNALKKDVDELPGIIERTDHSTRDARNAEFGRLRDSIDGNNRELRELIRELRQVIDRMREENTALTTRFLLFEQQTVMRLEALEKERKDKERRGTA